MLPQTTISLEKGKSRHCDQQCTALQWIKKELMAGKMLSGSESVAESCLGQVHLMPFTKLVAANNWSCLRSGNRQNRDRSRGGSGGRRCHHANRGGEVGGKARWETVSTRRRFSTLGPSWTGSLPAPDPRMSVSSTSWPTSRKG